MRYASRPSHMCDPPQSSVSAPSPGDCVAADTSAMVDHFRRLECSAHHSTTPPSPTRASGVLSPAPYRSCRRHQSKPRSPCPLPRHRRRPAYGMLRSPHSGGSCGACRRDFRDGRRAHTKDRATDQHSGYSRRDRQRRSDTPSLTTATVAVDSVVLPTAA